MKFKNSILIFISLILLYSCKTLSTTQSTTGYKIEIISTTITHGIATDKNDNVYIFYRAGRGWEPEAKETLKPPVILMYSKDGKLIDSIGAGIFILPHMITIDNKGNIWAVDAALQQIFKLDKNGKILLKLGEMFTAGNDSLHFNLPTDIAFLKDNSFYISDGYGNSRVVKFSKSGKWQYSWGKKGNQPGEFDIPHSISVFNKKVFVADRENSRLQIFDFKGKFITQLNVKDRVGRLFAVTADKKGRLYLTGDKGTTMLTPDLQEIKTWSEKGHDIAVDSKGVIYIVGGGGFKKISPLR